MQLKREPTHRRVVGKTKLCESVATEIHTWRETARENARLSRKIDGVRGVGSAKRCWGERVCLCRASARSLGLVAELPLASDTRRLGFFRSSNILGSALPPTFQKTLQIVKPI